MSRKKAPDAEQADAAPPKGKRRKLVFLALFVLVGAGGAYFVLGSGGKSNAATKPQPGAVVSLDHLTVNLTDGHYLRVGLALQLEKGKSLSASGAASADPTADGARALDETIAVFGDRDMSQLMGSGRDKLKAALLERLRKDYNGAVLDVYFTEFVMQ